MPTSKTLDFDKLAALEAEAATLAQQNVLLGQLLTQWITRFYGLHAASGALTADALLASVQNEAAAINAQLAAIKTPVP